MILTLFHCTQSVFLFSSDFFEDFPFAFVFLQFDYISQHVVHLFVWFWCLFYFVTLNFLDLWFGVINFGNVAAIVTSNISSILSFFSFWHSNCSNVISSKLFDTFKIHFSDCQVLSLVSSAWRVFIDISSSFY